MIDVVIPRSKLEYLNSCHELVRTRLKLEILHPDSKERILGIMKWHVDLHDFAELFNQIDSDSKRANPSRGEAWFGSYKHGPDPKQSNAAADSALSLEDRHLFGARVLEASESIQVMLGSDVDVMNLTEWVNHIHPSDIDYVVKTQIEFGVQMLPFEAEYRYFNTDLDAWRVLRCSSYPILKNTLEESCTQGVMLDVTDIRRAQQRLIDPLGEPFPINVE